MRYFILTMIIMLSGAIQLMAQPPDIIQLEYYYDTDPGFGNGTQVSVTANTLIDASFNIDATGLVAGFHTVYFRVKDENGSWSHTHYSIEKIFIPGGFPAPPPISDVVALEYYFDTDPGFGNGTPISVASGTITDTDFDIDVTGLDAGFHTVYFRVKNDDGSWSLTHYSIKKIFIPGTFPAPPPISDVVAIEYYFDTDPGFGNGTPISVSSGTITDTDFDIDVTALDAGFHTVYFRAKNANDGWSLTHYSIEKIFIPEPPVAPAPQPDIVALEYSLDTDPGFGNGTYVSVNQNSIIGETLDLDISGASPGFHDLYLRVMDENNKWSHIAIDSIEVSGVELKALLEGPFNGTDMNTTLNDDGNLPLSQPFNVAPWNYAGTESVVSIPDSNIVDWVLLETRNSNDPASANESTVSSRFAAFIKNDGTIVGLDGTSTFPFNTNSNSTGFVAVYHRNHLGILSGQALSATGGIYTYDFTTSADKAYNSGQKDLGGGTFGMYAGNANGDTEIGISDKTTWQGQTGTAGYNSADLDMNGQVTNQDKNDVWLINNNTQSEIPE